jgi:hypothetical protein
MIGQEDISGRAAEPNMAEKQTRLSYKFQRLRERLREAIETGILSGKLPGERVLARQFRVNAKTLSKALTDLAAEGLLERTIGRGTFVRGQVQEQEKSLGKWVVLVQPGQEASPLVAALGRENSDITVVSDPASIRPSLLSGCTAVVDLHGSVPETTLRDLMLRSLRIVLVDSLPRTYSTHSVMIDRASAAQRLARQMIVDGHSHLAVIERTAGEIGEAVRGLAGQLGNETRIECITSDQAVAAVQRGATALMCDSFEAASALSVKLEASRIEVPHQVSLTAVGVENTAGPRVSGFAVSVEQLIEVIRNLLVDTHSHKPAPMWLSGSFVDRGTMKPRAR